MYKSLKINLLVVIISIIVGILIFEVFIRSKDKSTNFGPQKRTYYARSTVEGIPYTLKPKMDKHFSFGRITSNGDGFRTTHSQTKKKGENVFRILTIGDSITFGFGVDQNQAYPQQLETILNILPRQQQRILSLL